MIMMNSKSTLLQNFLVKLFYTITHKGISYDMDVRHRDYLILLNQYLLMLAIIFFLHSVSNFIFLGYTIDALGLLIVSLFFGISCLYFNSLKTNKYFITLIFFILSFIITYYSSFCGIESGMYLFFIPLLSALPIFFSIRTDKYFVLPIAFFILICLYSSAIVDFKLFEKNKLLGNYAHKLLIINITSIIFLLSINYLFFDRKRKEYYLTLLKNRKKKRLINDLNNEVNRLYNILEKENLNEKDIKSILQSIHLNDVLYLQNFEKHFPKFFPKLNEISVEALSLAEMKLCSLIKLGFTSKEIALYTNSSIKSIESKKYRVRKKLRLSKNDDSIKWFSNI
ncbi:helix-turn-helix transcriptional regulator [Empedobacter falsenii]